MPNSHIGVWNLAIAILTVLKFIDFWTFLIISSHIWVHNWVKPFWKTDFNIFSLVYIKILRNFSSNHKRGQVSGVIHAIWSYNERWDFPRAGSSLFLPRFSGLTFLRFLGPFFIFSEIFASGVLYFLRWFFIFFQLLNEMKGTYMNNKKNLAALDLYGFFDSNTF